MREGAHRAEDRRDGLPQRRAVSRREFLRIAGLAGATVGLGGALAGALAACGGDTSATSTGTAAPPTTAGSTTTTHDIAPTLNRSTTTLTVGAGPNREVRIGFVSPLSGELAAYGVADQYCVDRALEAIGAGLICGDGQTHPIKIVAGDCQSDPQRAAEVAGELVVNSKVDIVVCGSEPVTVLPVAAQCETLEVPCLSTACPWEAYVAARTYGRIDSVFDWTYHVFWGIEDHIAGFTDVWAQVPTNKTVGAMFPDDDDGNAIMAMWERLWAPAGLTVVEESGFPDGTQDFTPQIQGFKKAGCEIGYGIFMLPDFTTFWAQAVDQGWVPKLPTYPKCLVFPHVLESLGDPAVNICTEVWWSPAFPYRSSLLNESCQDFAADFEDKAGVQWTQALVHFLVLEWAIDVLKRAKSVDDKRAIMDSVKSTKLETIAGPIDFTAPVEPADTAIPPFTGLASFKVGRCHIVENVYKSSVAAGQWRKGEKHPFELTIVGNKACPDVPVQDEVVLYTGA